MQEYYHSILQVKYVFGYLLESPHRGDSNKYPKHTLYEEIRIKHGICCISFCSLKILLQQQSISLGTNAVVVTRAHYTSEDTQGMQ